jgi:hypothetical protein
VAGSGTWTARGFLPLTLARAAWRSAEVDGVVGGCRVTLRTRSHVRPDGSMMRGDVATRRGMGMYTTRLLTNPTLKPVYPAAGAKDTRGVVRERGGGEAWEGKTVFHAGFHAGLGGRCHLPWPRARRR